MPAPINTFKRDLQNGKTLLGCWVGLVDACAAEISATAGFDWLLVDGEHAPNDIRSMVPQLQVIGASDSHPIVRLPHGEPWLIKQALDIGVQTLLIPMVESAEQAEQLVKATQYPPAGIRGVGAALARASEYSAIGDYIATADAQISLIVQIENRKGLAALDAILTIDGIDGVFIGPADLAADLGYPGTYEEPAVLTAITEALEKINASSKASGILAIGDDAIQRWNAVGVDFMGIGIDVTLFAGAMRELAAKYKT